MLQTTVGLLGEGEFKVVSDINNALIGGGYIKEATAVGGVLFLPSTSIHLPLLSCKLCIVILACVQSLM